jgi:hypothetical protein
MEAEKGCIDGISFFDTHLKPFHFPEGGFMAERGRLHAPVLEEFSCPSSNVVTEYGIEFLSGPRFSVTALSTSQLV